MKILILLLLLIGCNPKEKLSNYTCSKAQLGMVQREMDTCIKSGLQFSTCYRMARIAHCKYTERLK